MFNCLIRVWGGFGWPIRGIARKEEAAAKAAAAKKKAKAKKSEEASDEADPTVDNDDWWGEEGEEYDEEEGQDYAWDVEWWSFLCFPGVSSQLLVATRFDCEVETNNESGVTIFAGHVRKRSSK